MIERTVLQWTYEPNIYFEAPYNYSGSDYILAVADGKATMTLAIPQDPIDPDTLQLLKRQMKVVFDTRQLQIHRPFKLGGPHIYQYNKDGSNDVTVSVQTVAAFAAMGHADAVVTDASGKVIRDTKAERIKEQRNFLDLVAQKGHNPLLQSLLNSYSNAVNDPANELVHLYEVRDALARHFGNETKARKQLNITKSQWQRLGILANEEPLEQGRHRGKHQSYRRSASQDELSEARELVRTWIESFARLI